MRLNLGSCDRHFPGFLSVDCLPPADVIANLAEPWPWPDLSVDEIRAYDIIEHIGDCNHVTALCTICCDFVRPDLQRPCQLRHPRGPVHVMNEAWRVLRSGGRFDIEVPTTDGRGAWQDPTHVSYWNRNSFLYYTHGDAHRERFGRHYGVTARFKVLSEDHVRYPDQVVKLKIVLEAVK